MTISFLVSHSTSLNLDLPTDEMGNVFIPKADSFRAKFTNMQEGLACSRHIIDVRCQSNTSQPPILPVYVFKMPLTSNPSSLLLGLLNICRMLNCGLGVVGSQQGRKDVLPKMHPESPRGKELFK